MKKVLLFIAVILASGAMDAQVIISGVFDGPLSGGTPKAVELFVQADIADLSIYGIGSANNGGGTDGQEFTFPAIAATAGQYIYVTTDKAQLAAYMGMGFDKAFESGALSVNGDDAIELFQNGAVIDRMGNPDVDGDGQPWEYLDSWAYRTGDLATAMPITDATTFDTAPVAGWSFGGPNALDGETSNATAATPFPTAATAADLLPIELTYFTAKPTAENQVALEWRTESEENNDFMAVERSQDGQKFFEIGVVKGNGTTLEPQVYNFVDAAPKAGVNYYRLKQVDYDGTMEYHKVVAVNIKESIAGVSVYPTLVNDVVNVTFEGNAQLTVRNVAGKVMKQVQAAEFVTLNVADLAAGTYFLMIEAGQAVETVRFVKQ